MPVLSVTLTHGTTTVLMSLRDQVKCHCNSSLVMNVNVYFVDCLCELKSCNTRMVAVVYVYTCQTFDCCHMTPGVSILAQGFPL